MHSPLYEISKSDFFVPNDQLVPFDRVADPSSYLVFVGPLVLPFRLTTGCQQRRGLPNANTIIQSGKRGGWPRLFLGAEMRLSLHGYDLISSKLKCERRHQKKTATKTATK